MSVTLKDVAKLAGVSAATASRVLNNPEKVAEQSRSRVLAAIEELGYSSNLLAKSLREERLDAVYVMLPSLCDPFFAQMHQGALDVLSSYGYYMISAATEGSREVEKECLSKARMVGPIGCLLYTRWQDTVDDLLSGKSNLPTLLLSGNVVPKTEQVLSLELNREQMGRQAAEHLIKEQGRSKLIYLCEDIDGIDGEYWRGIHAAAKSAGKSCEYLRAARTSLDACRVIGEYWRRAQEKPDGILTTGCFQAAGAIEALRNCGICVPQQIAVATFENTPIAYLTTPQLTTVGPSAYQIGMRGAVMLLEYVYGRTGNELMHSTALDTKLISRGSSNCGN